MKKIDTDDLKLYHEVEKMLEEDRILKQQEKKDMDIAPSVPTPSLDILKKGSNKSKIGLYKGSERRVPADILPPEKKECKEISSEIEVPEKEQHCHRHHPRNDKIDIVSFDIPLFLRLLEWAKEDAKSDMDLHFLVENILVESKNNEVLTMHNYDALVDIVQSEEDSAEEFADDEYLNYYPDDCEIADFEGLPIVPCGIYEGKKKKKKRRFPRRGYGFIWPLWPMHMRPPPKPEPPKEDPDDVSDVEDVSTPDAPETINSVTSAPDSSVQISASSAPSIGGGEISTAPSIGVGGGDGGGAAVAAGGAVTEEEEEKSTKDNFMNCPIGQDHKNKIKNMEKKEFADLVAKFFAPKLNAAKDIVSNDLSQKLDVKNVKGASDQTIFVSFKNTSDGNSWIAQFELDKNGNLVVPESWQEKDKLGEHLFSSEEELKKTYKSKLCDLWP